MAFISFGILSKKLLLIPGFVIINIINLIITFEFGDKFNYDLYALVNEIGMTIVGVIFTLIFRPKNKKNTKKKRSVKDFAILFVFKQYFLLL